MSPLSTTPLFNTLSTMSSSDASSVPRRASRSDLGTGYFPAGDGEMKLYGGHGPDSATTIPAEFRRLA